MIYLITKDQDRSEQRRMAELVVSVQRPLDIYSSAARLTIHQSVHVFEDVSMAEWLSSHSGYTKRSAAYATPSL